MLFNAHHRTRYLLSDVARRVTSGLLARLLVWLFVSALFPLSVTATILSFNLEVLHRTTALALPPGAHVQDTLAERVLSRLEQFEKQEIDSWQRDDIRIAWIATLYASQGNPQPIIDATYRVHGLHPDKVWPAICARRAALLGRELPNEGLAVCLTATRVPEVAVMPLLRKPITRASGREFPRGVTPCADSRSGTADSRTSTKHASPHTSAAPHGESDRREPLHFPTPRKKAA